MTDNLIVKNLMHNYLKVVFFENEIYSYKKVKDSTLVHKLITL